VSKHRLASTLASILAEPAWVLTKADGQGGEQGRLGVGLNVPIAHDFAEMTACLPLFFSR